MIAAFARCCVRMPVLQAEEFYVPSKKEADSGLLQVIFAGPHRDCEYDKIVGVSSTCRVYLLADEWRPTKEIIEELEMMGVEKYS